MPAIRAIEGHVRVESARNGDEGWPIALTQGHTSNRHESPMGHSACLLAPPPAQNACYSSVALCLDSMLLGLSKSIQALFKNDIFDNILYILDFLGSPSFTTDLPLGGYFGLGIEERQSAHPSDTIRAFSRKLGRGSRQLRHGLVRRKTVSLGDRLSSPTTASLRLCSLHQGLLSAVSFLRTSAISMFSLLPRPVVKAVTNSHCLKNHTREVHSPSIL